MLPLKIAYRFLASSKGQTILIALGIAVGVSVQVFIGSLIQGLQISLVETTIGSSSQVTVETVEENTYINDYETIKNDLETKYPEISEISYSFNTPGSLVNDDDSEPILVRGFDYSLANGIYGFDEKLLDGTLPSEDNDIIIGKELAETMNLSNGDTIDIQIPLIGTTTHTITGIYDFNVVSINELWVMTTIPTVQTMLGSGDVVQSIEMQLEDEFEADILASNIIDYLDDDTLEVTNWKDQNADLLSGLQGQSVSSLMIQIFVTLSVVLGIASVLAITVLQKSKQLGILKAMGIKDKEASLIFLFEGLILGLIGAVLGVSLGLGLSIAFTKFAVNPDGTPVVDLYINPQFIAISTFIAILASTLASIIPARRSSKISVIEVIKNG